MTISSADLIDELAGLRGQLEGNPGAPDLQHHVTTTVVKFKLPS